jgi:hypothetical protein
LHTLEKHGQKLIRFGRKKLRKIYEPTKLIDLILIGGLRLILIQSLII